MTRAQVVRTIFPPPPFWSNSCAVATSLSGMRRLIGNEKVPSRTSSANSRSLDGSGRANTRVASTDASWTASCGRTDA